MAELLHYVLWSIFFVTAIAILLRRRSSRNLALPPGPRPLPLLGNLLELGQNPHRSFALLARTHGPVMYLKLGSLHTVVISSPASAKEVFITKDHSTCGRQVPDVIQDVGHHLVSVVWLPPNQSWRYLRTLMKANLFNAQSLDATQLLRRQKVRELIAYINGKNGEAVHIARAAFCTVLNLISTTFLSIDMIDIFKSESAQDLKDLMSGIMEELGRPNLSDFFPFLAPIDLQGGGGRKNHDILSALLQLSREENSKLSRKTIISFLIDLFVAGSDTSTTTLEWAMVELLRRPELMARARDEIATVIGLEREVEESDISRLPFLQAVLKETLRFHPPAPLLVPHKTEERTEINGYTVPKNSQVLVNVWAIGRDEQVWENPDCFMPERFAGGCEIDFRGHHFELLPFGSGRRICPGMPLGVRMVQLMLASLLQSFEWSLPDGMKPEDLDLTEKFGLSTALAAPLKAIATPTKHN
ncbi:geraniol 8-hydroxylase-like isoform X2 [Phalaenopsis equestris]|uniref:geraniol 8-hydroxylase-like isoform X2 n=1 Tax=Phalaenopsis equestris TaxID=78828 RepID=UPI0009E489F8|nr:geraniol 8-hydroxylase-like isoform X2 [Phalaenopsis equestris]